jgi:hypothetical protein
MKITDHGFCTYHVEMVTDYMCQYKQERCLDCEYLMSKEVYTTVEEAAELLGNYDIHKLYTSYYFICT